MLRLDFLDLGARRLALSVLTTSWFRRRGQDESVEGSPKSFAPQFGRHLAKSSISAAFTLVQTPKCRSCEVGPKPLLELSRKRQDGSKTPFPFRISGKFRA